MTNISRLRNHHWIALIVFAAAASIAAMLYLGLQAANRFQATERAWQDYNDHTRNVFGSLNALQQHLGYGGFIHNFKNYVLRRDPVYLEGTEQSARAAQSHIDLLRNTLKSAGEQKLLGDIQATIDEYLGKIHEASRQGAAEDMDAHVRVDDSLALDALEKLRTLTEERSFLREAEARDAFADAMSTLKAGSVVVVLILASAAGMIFLLIRISQSNARLNASLAYIEQLYNESPIALISVDEHGRMIRINPQTERLLRYSAGELSGRPVDSLIPPGHEEQRRALRDMLSVDARGAGGGGEGTQLVARRKDGSEVPVHLSIRVVTDIDRAVFLLALLDITEISELNEQLSVARQNAEAASEAKSRFLASMSHEIRTPLNGILGILQILQDADIAPDVARRLAIARESGLFLLTLINQVLDFARIESGEITVTKERFSLPAMVDAMKSMFAIRANLKGVEFHCDIIGETDLYLSGDYDHIRQILFNLIGNAVKFTETGSIALIARAQTSEDRRTCRIVFEVSDTGPGIREEDLEAIFEEFRQTEVGILHGGGTGLGLNISKRIADAIGATLTVESRPGSGTTFRLTVDTEIASNQEIAGEEIGQTSLTPLRVLVAEDNQVNQMIVETLLKKDGHSVTIAGDGSAALELVQQDPDAFDIILMDVQMPKMDGVQATIAIRQLVPDSKKLPIVGLTANAFQDQKIEYLSAGMQHVLTKPLDHGDMRKALERFVPSHALGASPRPAHPRGTGPAGAGHAGSMEFLDLRAFDELRKSMHPDTLLGLLGRASRRSSEIMNALKDTDPGSIEWHRALHELAGMLVNFGLVAAHGQIERILEEHSVSGTPGDLEHLERTVASSWRAIENELAARKP